MSGTTTHIKFGDGLDVTDEGGGVIRVDGAGGPPGATGPPGPSTGPAGGVLSGSYPNPGFAQDMATQAELDTGLAGKQPLDSDLTAIAALLTTPFGRSLLTLTDAGALLNAAAMGKNARVLRTSNQSIPDGALTAITFDSARYDTEAAKLWTASQPTRLTAKTAGVYSIVGNAQFDINTTGQRQLRIVFNSSAAIAVAADVSPSVSANKILNVATQQFLNVGDYVELVAYQSSGGALDVQFANDYSPQMMISKVG